MRAWPGQDMVRRVVGGGCELVPKVGLVNDQFRWRLSFSRAEGFLASQMEPKPRVCYLALKIYLKRKLKHVCPFVKSYHLKTLLFYFMETKSTQYWKETSAESVFLQLLQMLSEAFMNRQCPHYFIRELNLWESSNLAEYVKIRRQCIRGLQYVKETINRGDLVNLFLAPKVQSQILLDTEYKRRPWLMVCMLMGGVTICTVICSPVCVIMLVLVVQTVTVWIIGTVCCLPLIAVFMIIFVILRKTCK